MITGLHIDRNVKKTDNFHGGTEEAKKHLRDFIKYKLDDYPDLRNDPSLDYLSNMSPYLHFGQISPLYITLQIQGTDSPGKEAYLEELIVRRELSMNYVCYNQNYDSFQGLPGWTKRTLKEHERDPREHNYTLESF
ncbi:MAG: deoxyribodipyrimidine photolyase, partial [Candidatus Aenigmarchaeota archaeon]|nr:deoxyribodipyrimidine photolyase [Candidatus Aenigmarchaeota archaeon]